MNRGRTLVIMGSLAGALGMGMAPSATAVAQVPVQVGGPAQVSGADRIGPVDPERSISVQFALRLRNEAALEAAVTGVSRRHVTPGEFHALYAPDSRQTEALVAYLRDNGLLVEPPGPDALLVNASGTAAAVEKATGTTLSVYRDRGSRSIFRSNDRPATLPPTLASGVLGVLGLDDRARRQPHLETPRSGLGPAGGYTPSQVRSIYSLNTGRLGGMDGTGQTIGLLELDVFDQAHINTYDQQFYAKTLPAPTVVTIMGGTGSTACNGGCVEVELDIEVLQAIAPGASIRVYEAPNTDAGVNAAYSQMVTDGVSALSTSWGQCEAVTSTTELDTLHNIFLNAAARGVNAYAASGDDGQYDCRSLASGPSDPLYNLQSVDSPASDPNVVGVGGTNLQDAGNTAYGSESAWARSSPLQGSGGGVSSRFARPAWQAGSGVSTNSATLNPNNRRQVPDLAIDADPATGYSIYSDLLQGGAGWEVVGGTSAAAPAWAAVNALFNQSSLAGGGQPLPQAGPALYQAANCAGSLMPFHDVTQPSTATTPLYAPPTPGWDYATGWGSPNGGDLATVLSGQSSAPLAITGISPSQGLTTGGNQVSIQGCGFKTGATVKLGDQAGSLFSNVAVVSPGVITANAPAHTAGAFSIIVTNPGTTTATSPSPYTYVPWRAVGVTAPDGSLWYSANNGVFGGLGGRLLDAPAVASIPGPPTAGLGAAVFIGTGGDHDLWVTQAGMGWQPLSDAPVYCTGSPAATVIGSTLYVGCRGADNALWWSSTSVSLGSLPRIHAGWQSLGGAIIAGPAVAGLGGSTTPTFAALGTDHSIYTRTISPADGWRASPWQCNDHPALATRQSTSYFACQGMDGALWWATYFGGWSNAATLGGRIIGGPGIVAASPSPAFYAEGGDQAIWTRTPSSGWSSLGGVVNFGAAAAQLN